MLCGKFQYVRGYQWEKHLYQNTLSCIYLELNQCNKISSIMTDNEIRLISTHEIIHAIVSSWSACTYVYFLLYVYSFCIFSNHFVYFPTSNYELNTDSTLNITEVCLPIYSRPPCANMCEYNRHAEQSSDDFVSPLPACYSAIVYQVISKYVRVLFFLSPTKRTCFIGCKLEGA